MGAFSVMKLSFRVKAIVKQFANLKRVTLVMLQTLEMLKFFVTVTLSTSGKL